MLRLTIPLSLLFAFILLHGRGVPANLLSIGAIDFGIIIDGTVVMMENIYRELAERHGKDYKLSEVILEAARDVDRPIFYSVAVILAGYLPIYALTGPSGKLFLPMAETMSYALLGSLIFTLTLVPILASYWFKNGVKEVVNRPYEWVKNIYAGELDWCLDHPKFTIFVSRQLFLRFNASPDSLFRRRIHAAPPGRRRVVGSRHRCLSHNFYSRSRAKFCVLGNS